MTNRDRIFKAVLEDENLIKFGGYDPDDYDDVYKAIEDDNLTVSTVAKIVYFHFKKHTEKEIYKEVTNYLKNNL